MKRRKSHKGLVAVIGSLSALTLVSVGFASWVITETDSTTIDGEIEVDTVEDHRFLIKNKTALPSFQNIVFGAPSSATSGWLTADGEKVENLDPLEAASNKFDVYVLNLTSDLMSHFSVALTADDGYATAVTAGYVAALPTVTYEFKEVMNSGDYSGCGRVEVSFPNFAWGSYFGNNNPYAYYNDGKTGNGTAASGHGSGTWADDAKASLTALKTALTGVGYTLTITTLA